MFDRHVAGQIAGGDGVVVPEPGQRAGLVDEPVQVRLRCVDDITLAGVLRATAGRWRATPVKHKTNTALPMATLRVRERRHVMGKSYSTGPERHLTGSP